MTSVLRSRVAAVAAGALVVVGLGSVGAVAAGQLGSDGIRDNSVRGVDIKDGSVAWKDLNKAAKVKVDKKAPQGAVKGLKHRVVTLEALVAAQQGQIEEQKELIDKQQGQIDALVAGGGGTGGTTN